MPKVILQRYQDLPENTDDIRRLTGLNRKEFEKFHHFFKIEWDEYFALYTFQGTPRARQKSVPKNRIFTDTHDALLFILCYLNLNVSQNELAKVFGVDQPKVSRCLFFLKKRLMNVIETYPNALTNAKKERILNNPKNDKS